MRLRRRSLLCFGLSFMAGLRDVRAQTAPASAREKMLAEIALDMQATGASTGRTTLSPCVAQAMARVPRDRFVPPAFSALAWQNRPLPIGQSQTISQPFIVALMTELLDLAPTDVVLEVGTGSGYQAAVLAECVARVHTIEILAPLAERARVVLGALGYRNVEVRVGDGYAGLPEAAPFDAIIVTAAPDHVPTPLVEQLKKGGRMVIPIGARDAVQQLLLIRKESDGQTIVRQTIDVRFVPLTRAR